MNKRESEGEEKMSTFKSCKNDPSFKYSGKEISPMGLGYTSQAEEIGAVMEGRDKNQWKVIMKNNIKIWCKLPAPVKQLPQDLPVTLEKDAPVISNKDDGNGVGNPVGNTVMKAEKKLPTKKKAAAKPKVDEVEVEANAVVAAATVEEVVKTKKKAEVKTKKKAEEGMGVGVGVGVELETLPPAPKKRVMLKKIREAVMPEPKDEKQVRTGLAGYNEFRTREAGRIRAENPNMTGKDVQKEVARLWNEKKAGN